VQLVCFSAAQLGLDAELIELYRKRQPTISEHQQTIAGYLRLRPFDDAEVTRLEQCMRLTNKRRRIAFDSESGREQNAPINETYAGSTPSRPTPLAGQSAVFWRNASPSS
jgi:Domain of unknown function (DUF4158)